MQRSGGQSDAQRRVNFRQREEKLRWLLNANFKSGDLHIVLHYGAAGRSVERAEEDRKMFLRLIRKECKERGSEWRFVAVIELQGQKRQRIHHHMILPSLPIEVIDACWEKVLKTEWGRISVRPMDRRGNHAKLARYLLKHAEEYLRQMEAAGRKAKRYSCARKMERPVPERKIISGTRWEKEPKEVEGWILLKDDDGNTCRSGMHEVTGWPWREYFQIRKEHLQPLRAACVKSEVRHTKQGKHMECGAAGLNLGDTV